MKKILIKIIRITLWCTAINIKWCKDDLKRYERRNLWLEKHLKRLGGKY